MNSSKALGIVGIIIIIVAAAFGAYLMTQDDGKEDAVPEDPVLEYRLDVEQFVDGWGFTLSFLPTENGSCTLYLGDDVLMGGGGVTPMEKRFYKDRPVDWSYRYVSSMTADEAENLLNVRFSANIDAERVY